MNRYIRILLVGILFVFIGGALPASAVSAGSEGDMKGILARGQDQYDNGMPGKAGEIWGKGLKMARESKNEKSVGIFMGKIGKARFASGQTDGGIIFIRKAGEIAGKCGDEKSRAEWVEAEAEYYNRIGDLKKALKMYREALVMAKKSGNHGIELEALLEVGSLEFFMGIIGEEEKRKAFQEGLEMARKYGLRKDECICLIVLGINYLEEGDTQKALNITLEAEKLVESLDFKAGRYVVQLSKAVIFLNKGENEKFRELMGDALKMSEGFEDIDMIFLAMPLKALNYKLDKKYQKALDYYSDMLETAENTRCKKKIGLIYAGMGDIYKSMNRIDEAGEYFKKALSIARETGEKREMAGRIFELAFIELKRKDFEAAERLNLEALKLAEKLEMDYKKKNIMLSLGVIYKEKKQYDKAREYLQKVMTVDKQDKEGYLDMNAYTVSGDIFLARRDFKKALAEFEKAVKIAATIKSKGDEAQILARTGYAWMGLGATDKAYENFRQALKLAHAADNPELETQMEEQISKLDETIGFRKRLEELRIIVIPVLMLLMLGIVYFVYRLRPGGKK